MCWSAAISSGRKFLIEKKHLEWQERTSEGHLGMPGGVFLSNIDLGIFRNSFHCPHSHLSLFYVVSPTFFFFFEGLWIPLVISGGDKINHQWKLVCAKGFEHTRANRLIVLRLVNSKYTERCIFTINMNHHHFEWLMPMWELAWPDVSGSNPLCATNYIMKGEKKNTGHAWYLLRY